MLNMASCGVFSYPFLECSALFILSKYYFCVKKIGKEKTNSGSHIQNDIQSILSVCVSREGEKQKKKLVNI